MSRTQLVTKEDLSALEAALTRLAETEDELHLLRDRCLAKDDHVRAGRLRIALNRLEEAREVVEGMFR